MTHNLKVINYIKYKALPATVVPVWHWLGEGVGVGGGVGGASRHTIREPSIGRDKSLVLFTYFATASTIVTSEAY
jgi:hypothetical protein